MRDLDGKVAIVTGGTGGIGRGIALKLAGRGAAVVVNGRSAQKGIAIVDEIVAAGGSALFAEGDVRAKAEMEAVAAQGAERFGGVDIVVANAGGSDDEARDPRVRGPFPTIDLELAAAFVGKAMLGKLLVVQAAVPFMRRRGGGSVVFVTSEGGRVATPTQTAIASVSGGLIMAGKVLSKDLARDRIRVNTVCVTLVRDSPSWDAAFQGESAVSERHRKQYQKIVDSSPLGVAAPQDIGDVVAFFASEQSLYLTGAVLSPTGGLTLH